MILFLLSFGLHAENVIPKGHLRHQYFVMRHGESIPNRENRLCSSLKSGVDPKNGLTEKGKQQAKESIQEWMKSHADPSVVIVTSVFSRALETAEMIQKELEKKFSSVRVINEKRLIERYFGKYDGKPYSEAIWKKVSAQDQKNPMKAIAGVEPLDKLETRMTQVIAELEKENGVTFIIVSHGDPLATLQNAFEGKPLRQTHLVPRINNAEIRELKHH